ncbi:MAG: sigma-70 family RNA polymerase sigma factor [Bacteroidaceae bacterium]|nr:sigma-70 family RNA polymerase sigma factor [Bacteroidaceae bacterium]
MDERRLAELCRRKDDTAWSELYRSYASRLRAVSVRYMQDKEDAEDVLQDAFVRMFDNIGSFSYRGEGSLWAWMKRITVNTALMELRKSHSLALVPLEEADPVEEPDAESVRQIPQKDLLAMIAELPVGSRAVLNLFCIEGYSHKEIARMLHIKEKSSSSQLARARRVLSRRIGEYMKNGE